MAGVANRVLNGVVGGGAQQWRHGAGEHGDDRDDGGGQEQRPGVGEGAAADAGPVECGRP
ncbi:hypothetical protein GCM10029978_008860 [Actinoallomurus acanthiterrae]